MKKVILSLSILSLLFAFSANAIGQIEEGNTELSVMASYTSMSVEGMEEAMGFIMIGGSLGYFFTQNIEVGGSVYYYSSLGEDAMGMGFLSPFLTYHFITENPKLVPYIGVNASIYFFNYPEEIEAPSVYGIGANGGLKYFISEKTSLGPQIRWDHQFYSIEGIEETLGADQIQLLLVLSTLF